MPKTHLNDVKIGDGTFAQWRPGIGLGIGSGRPARPPFPRRDDTATVVNPPGNSADFTIHDHTNRAIPEAIALRDECNYLAESASANHSFEVALVQPAASSPPSPIPSEFDPKHAITTGRDDASEQVYILVSEESLAQIETFATAACHTLEPAVKSQIEGLQKMFRRFGQVMATRPETLVEASHLHQLQARFDREAALHNQSQTKFDQEVALRGQLQKRLDSMSAFAEEETRRANRNEAMLDEHRATVAHLIASPPAPPSAAGRTLREIEDPEPYGGSREGLRKFRSQLRLVFAEGERFVDEQHRLRYCFRLLRGEAFATMEPFLGPNGHIEFETAEVFLNELTRIFGDPDENATAAHELDRLRQGNREFSRYFAEYIRLVTTLGYSDGHRRYVLERGLSVEILEALSYHVAPADETPAQHEDRIRRLDDNIRRFKALNKPLSPPGQPGGNQTAATTSTRNAPGPTDFTALAATSGQPLTPEERARLLAEGLCLYCSGPGHRSRDCPKNLADRAAGNRGLRTAATRNRGLRAAATTATPATAEAPTGDEAS